MKISKKEQKEEDYPVEGGAKTAFKRQFLQLRLLDFSIAPGAELCSALDSNFRAAKRFRGSGENIPRIRLESSTPQDVVCVVTDVE